MTWINYDTEGRLAYITINRPDKRNAFNGEVVAQLHDAFRRAEAEAGVRAIILRAAGEVFSAGADLAYLEQLQTNTYAENLADSTRLMALYRYIYQHPKPVIAQVEGHAIAGGCGLATVCDFCFAVPEAKFGYTEVRIGFIPAIVMVFLLRKIGESAARDLLLTGRLIGAEQAQAMGLISGIWPKGDIADEVQQFAERLCRTASADSLRLTKALMARVPELGLDDALLLAAEKNAEARATPDCQRGIASFLSKSELQW